MADIVTQRNIGQFITNRLATKPLAWTAAGASDNVTWTGVALDREGFVGGSIPLSAVFSLFFSAVLASGATLTAALNIQEGADGTNFSDFQTMTGVVVATGPSGGGQVTGVSSVIVNLGSARRYVRSNFTADLSAAGTDTAIAAVGGTLAGFDRLASPT